MWRITRRHARRQAVFIQRSATTVNDTLMGYTGAGGGFCRSRFPRFTGTGSFLSCKVFFGETLFSCFCFPVIVSHPTAVLNHPATELTKH